jgi:hypothetical protein
MRSLQARRLDVNHWSVETPNVGSSKGKVVIRATCFAAGMFVCLWGLAFLAIDKVVLHQPTEKDPGIRGMLAKQTVDKEQRPIIDPPDWAAFTLLSIGSVSMLYAVALPKNG